MYSAKSQYGVAIENTQHRGYFTEKILDLFLLKTIPIYWGCSNIKDFFNPQGIIYITSIDEAIYKLNNVLDADYYEQSFTCYRGKPTTSIKIC